MYQALGRVCRAVGRSSAEYLTKVYDKLRKPFLMIFYPAPHVRMLPATKVEGVLKKQQEKEKQMWSKAFS